MSDLEDVFGEDFADHVKQRTAERRQERNRITKEQLKDICSRAINEGEFSADKGDPRFTYTTENGITHEVLLMQVPDPEGREIWQHLSEPWDGAARLPLDYLGQWYWSVFPEKKDVSKVSQGDHVIVAGDVSEDEGDNGEVYYNVYPVRGIATLDKAKEYADEVIEEGGFSDDNEPEVEDVTSESSSEPDTTPETEPPEQEQQEQEEVEESDSSDDNDELSFDSSSSSSSSSTGGLKGMLEEENGGDVDDGIENVPYEDVAHVVERLAEKQDEDEEPHVYEIEEGSMHHQRLTQVVINQIDELDNDMEDDVKEVVIDVIKGHRDVEDEEEEEDETGQLFDL